MPDAFDRLSALYLILKYPPLGNYIQEAYNREDYTELIDFLFDLDLDDKIREQ